jgi:hypothetical protein
MSIIVCYLHKMSTDELNLSTKKYVKSQPVDFKFIPHHISILKILFDGRKNENQIFRALTKNKERIAYQSDKDTMIIAIKQLMAYNLVTITECESKKIKKKRWMQIRRTRPKIKEKIVELTLWEKNCHN